MEKEGKEIVEKDSKLGSIRIADEVVSIIAGLAATEIDGVAGMSGGIVSGVDARPQELLEGRQG